MMDLPAPAPMYDQVYTYVKQVACEQERVGPLLKLALSDAENEGQPISVVAVFERMDCEGIPIEPLKLVGRLLSQNGASTRQALVALAEQPEVMAQWFIEGDIEGKMFHSEQKPVQLAMAHEELAAGLDDTLLPPINSRFAIAFKTGMGEQNLRFSFHVDPIS